MRHAAWNEVFVSRIYWNSLAVDDEGIAPLNNDHVFVVFMDMGCGFGCHSTRPICHLASISALVHITHNSRSGLTGGGNLNGRVLHEFRKFIHITAQYLTAMVG